MTESHVYGPPIEAMSEDDKPDSEQEQESSDAPSKEKISRDEYLKKVNKDFPGRFGLDGQLYDSDD